MEQDFLLVLLVFKEKVMINGSGWGDLYLLVRGEIRGFSKDTLLRRHLARTLSSIKNDSRGIEDDQIPS